MDDNNAKIGTTLIIDGFMRLMRWPKVNVRSVFGYNLF